MLYYPLLQIIVLSLSNENTIFVFLSIILTSPRDSTFRRTTGSVLEVRKLKRQSAKVMLIPSVRSTASASLLKCCSTRLIASAGCANLVLISPLAGNAAMRSRTNSPNIFPFKHTNSATSNHGIIPLSQ